MKISVVTATWNSGKTIKDTIESVLHQKYTNVEHIIKDGGSQDNTMAICEDYQRRFYSSADAPGSKVKTMKIVSEKDGGIYDAMNKGLAMATGEVIGILMTSTRLMTYYRRLQRSSKRIQVLRPCMATFTL